MGFTELPNEVLDMIGEYIQDWGTFHAFTQLDARNRSIFLRKCTADRFPIDHKFEEINRANMRAFLYSAINCKLFDEVFMGAGIRLMLGEASWKLPKLQAEHCTTFVEFCHIRNIQSWWLKLWDPKRHFQHRVGKRIFYDREFLQQVELAMSELQMVSDALAGRLGLTRSRNVTSIKIALVEVCDNLFITKMPRALFWTTPMGKFIKQVIMNKSLDALLQHRHSTLEDIEELDNILAGVVLELDEVLKICSFACRVLSG